VQDVLTRQSDIGDIQLSDSSDKEEEAISLASKEMDRYFVMSLASLGLSAAAYLFYAPLSLISLLALFYPAGWFFRRSFDYIFKDNRVATALTDICFFGGALMTGHYFASSLMLSCYFFSRKLLLKTEDHSRGSLINVFGKQPRFVWIQKEGCQIEIEVPFEQVQVGDVVVVHAGATIPVDGTVTSGQARVSQRALTGESQPVEKEAGHDVFAGTILLSGQLSIQVEKAGADTVAAQIGDILNSTADFKSTGKERGESIVDQGAIVTVTLSTLTLFLMGPISAIAAFNAAFGCHMRIAAPISVLTFLRIASENGVLIKACLSEPAGWARMAELS
jgi:Cu2+-exporting ATPase